MRILFLICPSKSHLYAIAPLAWALRTSGHDVRVASQPWAAKLTAEDIARTGLTPVSIGDEVELGGMRADRPNDLKRKSMQSDYAKDDPRRELDLLARGHFRGFSPDSLIADAIRFARSWKPDLIIWDSMTMTFSGPVVARACGAVHARFVFTTDALVQLRTAVREQNLGSDPMRDCLEPILERFGMDFTEEMVVGQWSINSMPPWTWLPPDMHYLMMRSVPFNGPSVIPEWLHEEPERERVCITAGLSFPELTTRLSTSALLQAVADLDAEVVVTLSREQAAALPSLPGNVRMTEFVPLTALLPSCSAIVHHGGYGTFISAIEHAVPQLVMPSLGNDKYWGPVAAANGLEKQGAGVHVSDPGRLTPDALRDHLVNVLKDPAFRRNAARLRDEAAEMPTPNDVVPAIEKLTAGYRP
jgi:glycosyltransferase (activator-dependent family)